MGSAKWKFPPSASTGTSRVAACKPKSRSLPLAGVSGEVLTMINEHLKKAVPSRHVVMVTHANGSSGYIPDDAAFAQVSYEITTTRLKPGCAETAIMDDFAKFMLQR